MGKKSLVKKILKGIKKPLSKGRKLSGGRGRSIAAQKAPRAGKPTGSYPATAKRTEAFDLKQSRGLPIKIKKEKQYAKGR